MITRLAALMLATALGVCAPIARAGTLRVIDVVTMARILTFQDSPAHGRVELGVLGDPNDPGTRQNFEVVREAIGDGLLIGDMVLSARLIQPSDLARASNLVGLVVLGADRHVHEAAANFAGQRKILAMSVEEDCIAHDFCAVLVRSSPKIQLFANSKVAAASDVRFRQSFAVMLKEHH